MEFVGNYIVARAQTISYILLFLEVVFIEKMLRENKAKYILILLPISVFIANIHTSIWPMTLILFLPYLGEYIVSKLFHSKVLYSETNNIKLLSISFLIILLSGLLTPLGLLPYTYMFKTLSGISSEFIIELQHANIFRDFILLLLILLYGFLFILRKKIKISDIFLISGLFIMSLMAIRNIPFLIILGAISLSRLIYDTITEFKIDINIITDKICKNKLVMCLITLFVIIISSIFCYMHIYNKEYIDISQYPVKASDYILDNINLDELRLYNGFNNGSYLEFRGIKVLLDSRSEVYCKEFNDTSILEDWFHVTYGLEDYKPVFDKYNFTHILLYKSEPLNIKVASDKDYKKIYEDEYFVLYEKVE
jgi:hypothetical protein